MAFDLNDPSWLWYSALLHWASRGGDLSRCADLVREGVAIPGEHAATFADILAGLVVPKSTRGGASPARQLNKYLRDIELRGEFSFRLHERRCALYEATGRRKLVSGSLREQVAAELAAEMVFCYPGLPKKLTTEEVIEIVKRSPKGMAQSFDELVRRT
jgi:hypothetical protein